jgi:hypothetical protein
MLPTGSDRRRRNVNDKKIISLVQSMPTTIDIYDKIVAPPTLVGEDSAGRKQIVLSAEDKNSFYFADYYGEFRGGCPWIHPALETWAKDHGFYWEWVNPGAVALVKVAV